MLIYKNKASQKFFIFLEDSGNNEGLFVTPPFSDKVVIHSLKYDLFIDDPIELEEDDELVNELLSIKQIERYKEFRMKNNMLFFKKFIDFAISATEPDIRELNKETGHDYGEAVRLIKEKYKGRTAEDIEDL